MNHLFGTEDGFTIQEVLVTIIVSSLIVSFGLSLFLFAQRFAQMWEERVGLHNSVHSVTHTILADVRRAERFIVLSDSCMTLQRPNGDSVLYAFVGTGPLRNGIPTISPSHLYWNVRILPLEKSGCVEVLVSASGREQYSALTLARLRSSAKGLFAKSIVESD